MVLPLVGGFLVIAGISGTSSALAATTTFNYTGAEQTYTVPTGATAVTITAVGARGGTSRSGAPGGNGARVTATVPLPAGTTTLYVEVGGAGTPGPCTYALPDGGGGGFNGGGSTGCGGGGGGASDVRITSTSTVPEAALTSANDSRLVVAGGGGGGGYVCQAPPGGAAGDDSVRGAGPGGAGSDACGGAAPGGSGGQGGTSGGPGGAGTSAFPCPGAGGALGQGGNTGLVCDNSDYGGGGGGGYYGGGAGGDGNESGGGGGAGSSAWSPAATNTSIAEDSTGTPQVQITPVISAPDLSVTTNGPATVTSGTSFSYTVVVTNSGGSSARDVVVGDAVPATAKYDAVSATAGTCSRAEPATPPKTKGGAVTCTVGELAAGGSATVTITVMATTPGTVDDSAVVAADAMTADADDAAWVATLVQGS